MKNIKIDDGINQNLNSLFDFVTINKHAPHGFWILTDIQIFIVSFLMDKHEKHV